MKPIHNKKNITLQDLTKQILVIPDSSVILNLIGDPDSKTV